eukprot:XP_011431681.1 PREDICTED: heat shock 70 kDa protein 12A isoform X2 [Crassostrea gigas]
MSRLPKKGDNRPVAVSDNNRPVIASDNRPVAVSDNNRPVAVSDNNRPVAVSDNNRPVAVSDNNRPVAVSDNNRPVAVSDDNRPVIARDDNRPVVASEKLFVCAIDFGTTYSGYAYSTRQNPIKIYCPHWHSGSTTLISYKTPTTVLLDEQMNFLAFGYEAEKKYLELAEDDASDDFYYFRRFKMILYDKLRSGERLSTKTTVSDIIGKEMLAVDVFSHAIKYLKDHLLKEHKDRGTSIKDLDIHWVLTVPAIWDDPAKQFMRKAAEKAGIDSNRLVIALEPEAASILCKELQLAKYEDGSDSINVFSPGQRYLVLDAGGGTIDMTVHEVKSGGKLHELSRASGGDWGGVLVDKTFKQMLIDIVGEEFMEEYCRFNTADYIDVLRDFEIKKREKSETKLVTLKISPTFSENFKKKNSKSISQKTKDTKYAKLLKWEGDKIRMDRELFESFFTPSCKHIVDHVGEILSNPKVKGTKVILMVGGFSESAILQDAVRKAFPECRVVVPHEAGLAVLKGAVLFGHDQSVVASRVAKFTYGIGCSELFDPKKHDPKRKTKDKRDGKERCHCIFSKHVEAGDVLILNEDQGKHVYHPIYADQTTISFPVYTSKEPNPMYTDEPGCNLLGTLEMDISDITGGLERGFEAKFQFGGTEITVSARNVRTNETAAAEFNFLDDEP